MRISDWSSDVCSSDLERQRADARDQIAVGDECAATAALAETEILQRDQHGDRETVVDRGIFDVGRGDPRLGEGGGARHPPGRPGDVDRAAVQVMTRLDGRSEEHTSELQSLLRTSYAVFCLNKKK